MRDHRQFESACWSVLLVYGSTIAHAFDVAGRAQSTMTWPAAPADWKLCAPAFHAARRHAYDNNYARLLETQLSR